MTANEARRRADIADILSNNPTEKQIEKLKKALEYFDTK